MRLIDADALIKVIQQNDYMLTANHNSMAPGMFTSGIRQAVDESQTIDPVKHGNWIDTDFCNTTGEIYECSACHKFYNPDKKAVMQSRQKENPDFCPTCGAHMIGGEND